MKLKHIIYSAAFFDGEGGIYKINGKNAIQIRIVNTNREVIYYLHSLWGGMVYARKQKENRKDSWDCILSSRKEVSRFVNSVYPFLIVKKEKVNDIIANTYLKELL